MSRLRCASSSRSEGSDLHLKVGSPPLYRVHGELAADADGAGR